MRPCEYYGCLLMCGVVVYVFMLTIRFLPEFILNFVWNREFRGGYGVCCFNECIRPQFPCKLWSMSIIGKYIVVMIFSVSSIFQCSGGRAGVADVLARFKMHIL